MVCLTVLFKALLVAGSDHFGAILADSEQHNTIKVDLTDVEFSSVKRFLYTGTVYFENKPYEYSKVVLPKLVKVTMARLKLFTTRYTNPT